MGRVFCKAPRVTDHGWRKAHPDVLTPAEHWACNPAHATCLGCLQVGYTAFYAGCEKCMDWLAALAMERPTAWVDYRTDSDPLGEYAYTAIGAVMTRAGIKPLSQGATREEPPSE